MSLETALAYFRKRQADLFRSTCTITRAGGEGTFNPSTGAIVPAASTTVYSGPCLIRSATTGTGADTQVGQEEIRYRFARGKFPVDTPIEKDDVVTVTTSTHDADLVGRVFRITDVFRDDWQIARVAALEEAT